MRDLDDLFSALRRSQFRSRQRPGPKERAYLESKSLDTVLEYGRRFVAGRLSPAEPANDGRQTPMRRRNNSNPRLHLPLLFQENA